MPKPRRKVHTGVYDAIRKIIEAHGDTVAQAAMRVGVGPERIYSGAKRRPDPQVSLLIQMLHSVRARWAELDAVYPVAVVAPPLVEKKSRSARESVARMARSGQVPEKKEKPKNRPA